MDLGKYEVRKAKLDLVLLPSAPLLLDPPLAAGCCPPFACVGGASSSSLKMCMVPWSEETRR